MEDIGVFVCFMWLDNRKKLLMGRVVQHWNRLSRVVLELLPLELLEKCVDMALGDRV